MNARHTAHDAKVGDDAELGREARVGREGQTMWTCLTAPTTSGPEVPPVPLCADSLAPL